MRRTLLGRIVRANSAYQFSMRSLTRDDATFCQTATGGKVWPLAPLTEDIKLEDIAIQLSHICRFGGATKWFYSVAQHSVLVSQHCSPGDALWGLLHDAAEAYIGDMMRPIKEAPGVGTAFRRVEERLLTVIAERFGLYMPIPWSVKLADEWVLAAESQALMKNPELVHVRPFGKTPGPAILIELWSCGYAQTRFLERFEELAVVS